MMKLLKVLSVVLALAPGMAAMAQELTPEPMPAVQPLNYWANYGWCGYVAIEGLVMGPADIVQLQTLGVTPEENPNLNPAEYIQVTISPDEISAIVDGCYTLPFERERLIARLVTSQNIDYETLDILMQLTVFPGETPAEGARGAIAWLVEHATQWLPYDAVTP